MPTRLSYATLVLSSSELIDFSIDREFKINTQSTIGVNEITLPSNLTPISIQIVASIRDDAEFKFNNYLDLIESKPYYDLVFLGKNWGKTFLNRLSIKSNEIDNNGKILRMDLDIGFIINVGFG